MSPALFPINPGHKIMCQRKNLANNARSYVSTPLPLTVALRSLQHTERQPLRKRCFRRSCSLPLSFFLQNISQRQHSFSYLPILTLKTFDVATFYRRLNRNIIIIIIIIIIVVVIIIIIISLVTSGLVQTSIALQVSLTILKVEAWSKQCHKPAPIGQDDKH